MLGFLKEVGTLSAVCLDVLWARHWVKGSLGTAHHPMEQALLLVVGWGEE